MPAPATIFEAIRKLPPAHVLVAEHGRVRITQLLGSATSPATATPRARSEYLEELDALADASRCGMRLISDVPLGAFLSGGIDSTRRRRAA